MSKSHSHSHSESPDHVPHVLPTKVYLGTWLALVVLTAITVGVSYVDFGAFNLVIALLVATTKAAVVALIFMHLLFDDKFNLVILGSSVIFLAIFLAFTMFDTELRGKTDSMERERPANIDSPFIDGTKKDAKIRKASAALSAKASGSVAAPSH